MNDAKYLTISEVARILRVSDESVRRFVAQGKLHCERTQFGFRIFKPEDVQALADEREKNPPKRWNSHAVPASVA